MGGAVWCVGKLVGESEEGGDESEEGGGDGGTVSIGSSQ